MSNLGKESPVESGDEVEALLGQAAPRPMPPEAETREVREAVRTEWQKTTGRRRAQKRVLRLAMAASVLLAVFVSLNTLRINGVEQVQVASIAKRVGSVHVLGENSQLLEGGKLTSVVAGQTLVTDDDSGVGLSWGAGGSLRIDANTRVEFIGREEIYLRSGRVYFDSEPLLIARGSVTGSDARLRIQTDFGEVTHFGTRYMAHAQGDVLTISVRDGEVAVQTGGKTNTASRNQQLAISGSGVRSIVNIRPHGTTWQWIEQTSPSANLDGRAVSEFLDWVSQETGLQLEYESAGAESYARQELLNGKLETGPRQALEAWMLGTDLGWRIEDGVIYVNEAR